MFIYSIFFLLFPDFVPQLSKCFYCSIRLKQIRGVLQCFSKNNTKSSLVFTNIHSKNWSVECKKLLTLKESLLCSAKSQISYFKKSSQPAFFAGRYTLYITGS